MKLRIRMWIADLLDRLFPKSCWCDLVQWAYGIRKFSEIDLVHGRCQLPPDFDIEWGGCYCHKFATEEEATR